MRVFLGVLLLSSIAGFALLASGYALYDRSQQTSALRAQQRSFNRQLAQAANDNREAWHKVLCYAESQVLASKSVTPERRASIVHFYENALALVNARPCKEGR